MTPIKDRLKEGLQYFAQYHYDAIKNIFKISLLTDKDRNSDTRKYYKEFSYYYLKRTIISSLCLKVLYLSIFSILR